MSNKHVNTTVLVNSLKFLKAFKMSPISCKNLQEIIHHGSEHFDDLKKTKIKFMVENPENTNKLVFEVNQIEYVKEINMLSLQHEKDFNLDAFSLFGLQQIINDLSSNRSDWSSIIVNCENVFLPSDYLFTDDNEVILKLRNPFKEEK